MGTASERAQEIASFLDEGLERVLRGALKTAFRGICYAFGALALLTGCLLFATFTFLFFRALVVPRVTEHRRELHFDYRMERPVAQACFLNEKHLLNSSHTRSDTNTNARFLASKQKFDVELELVMPESEANLAVGMFQISAELLAMDNTSVIASTSRPAILHYRSPLVRLGRTLFFLPWMIFDWYPESQNIQVVLFSGVEDKADLPFATLRVVLQSRATDLPVPELYGAKATVSLRLGLLASMMKRWKWITSFYGILILYGTFIYATGLFLLLSLFYKKPTSRGLGSPDSGRDIIRRNAGEGLRKHTPEEELEITDRDEIQLGVGYSDLWEQTALKSEGDSREEHLDDLTESTNLRRRNVFDTENYL